MEGRNWSIVLVAILLLSGLLSFALTRNTSLLEPPRGALLPGSVLYLGTVPIETEIAGSDEERRRGLSGRDALPEGRGMLFVFPSPGIYSIWMQNMKLPIDAFWIDENLRVVWVEKHLTPDTYPRTFASRAPARFILETNADVADNFDINVGTRVVLPRGVEPYHRR